MSNVLIERDSGVVTVTLNRPDAMNALSPELFQELIDVFAALRKDSDVGAVILTGRGKAFCAGGDIKAMSNRDAWSFEERHEDLLWKHELALLLGDFPAIVIGAINGVAMGAGLGLALLCDFRIVARSATFATSFGTVAFSGDFLTSLSLTRLIGPIKAKELMILNRRFDAAEADALGLATKLVDDARLMDEARAFAGEIAAGPRVAHRYMKKNIHAAWNATFAGMVEMETMHQVRSAMTEDHAEARAAFAAKRAPAFRGR